MIKKWNKERDDETGIIWVNIKDSSITVEAYFDDGELLMDEEDTEAISFWYAFTGKDGAGIENSPYMRESKKEIISVIADLKKEYDE